MQDRVDSPLAQSYRPSPMSSPRSDELFARDAQGLVRATSLGQNQLFIGIFAVSVLMLGAMLFGVFISGIIGISIFAAVIGFGALALFVPDLAEKLLIGAVVLIGLVMGAGSVYIAASSSVSGHSTSSSQSAR